MTVPIILFLIEKFDNFLDDVIEERKIFMPADISDDLVIEKAKQAADIQDIYCKQTKVNEVIVLDIDDQFSYYITPCFS
jgi:hypothetical protein